MSVRAVAVEARTDAFPIAGTHGERITHGDELLAVGAIPELVTVLHTVVGDTQVELVVLTRLNDYLPSPKLSIDTLWAQANGIELLANAEEAGIAVAFGGE